MRHVYHHSPMNLLRLSLSLLCGALLVNGAMAADAAGEGLTLEECLRPYHGPTAAQSEAGTLDGKVMCGYQGWFGHPDDGYHLGMRHWGEVLDRPPVCRVDMWPDLSEYGPHERFPVNLFHRDGKPAEVFSSTNRDTVLRHFRWMKEYGIGGVFVQRFASQTATPEKQRFVTAVLNHCREGANTYGRTFAVMYDMDFKNQPATVKSDWTRLVREMHITESPAYQKHAGHPVVALWGFGVGKREVDPAITADLFAFFKKPENGACTIMLGTGNNWRTLPADAGGALLEQVDIISPWTVGRFNSPADATAFHARTLPDDLAWCKAHAKDYYPVAFPGFSWKNLQDARQPGQTKSPLNQIPRLKGQFLWSQVEAIQHAGLRKLYVAMFDEIDEGTAIFKCTNTPPIGNFVTYDGQPSDTYLRLTGAAARFLSGKETYKTMPTFP